MPLYGTVNVRVPEDTYRKIDALLAQYGSRTSVIVAAVDVLYSSRPGKKQAEAAKEENTAPTPSKEKPPSTKTALTQKPETRYQTSERGKKIIARIAELHEEGKGQTAIADILNAEEIKTLSGGTWDRAIVNGIVVRYVMGKKKS